MNKKMRFTLTMLIGTVLVLSLTMCKKSDAQAAAENDGALKQVNLKMIAPGTPQVDQALVNASISEYLADELNVNFEFEQIDWAGWQDRNNLIIASGEEVDVLFTAPWSGYETNAAKGAFLDVAEMLPEYAPGIANSNYNWTLVAGKVGDKLYGIPTYQMMAQQRGFLVNKALLDKYDMEFDESKVYSPEDFEPYLKVIKENEPNIIPLYTLHSKLLSFTDPWERQGPLEVTSIDATGDEAVYQNIYKSDMYIKNMKIARDWFEKGYVNADIATTREDPINMLAAGNCFAIVFQTNPPARASQEKMCGKELAGFHLMPAFMATSLIQGAMFSIPRTSKNPERALMFLDKMHTDKKLVNMLVYGLEDRHFVKVSDNAIKAAPGIDPDKPSYYNLQWMFGNQALLYTYGDEDPEAPSLLDKFNQDAIKSPALGFTYDSSAMRNEIAALSNVAAEFDPVISAGVVDVYKEGTYDTFLAKLEAAGIDRLLEDQNKQLNEWLSQQ